MKADSINNLRKLVEKYVEDLKDRDLKDREEVKQGWREHEQFIRKFPFKKHPERIDGLTPDDLYWAEEGKPRDSTEYFFYWIETKLKNLGKIAIGSATPFRNARDQINDFKDLLRKAVGTGPLADKINADWEKIKGFGRDKHIAKKIIFCYDPIEVLPVFKTDELEHFVHKLDINRDDEASHRYGKSYDSLTLGQKFELLNRTLLGLKKSVDELEDWDNARFVRLLYNTLLPESSRSRWWPPGRSTAPSTVRPLARVGLLFEPTNELEVIYLFSAFHRELGFPFIIKIRSQYPDARVLNENGELVEIEFEYRSSNFKGHPIEECDFIVCWDDDWTDAPEDVRSKIIPLKDKLKEVLRIGEG